MCTESKSSDTGPPPTWKHARDRPISILSVRSQKVHYLPEEEARFIGEIENQGDRECEVSARCRLVPVSSP